jgi:hypothetical protein
MTSIANTITWNAAHADVIEAISRQCDKYAVTRLLQLGGQDLLRQTSERYRHKATRRAVLNFIENDADDLVEAFDAVLVIDVAERIEAFEPIVLKCLSLKPKIVMVVFSNGLVPRGACHRKLRDVKPGEWRFDNRYALRDVQRFAMSHSQIILDYDVISATKQTLRTEHLVVFRVRGPAMMKRLQNNVKRGVSFLKVITDTVITQRGEWASEEVIKQRVAICTDCRFFKPQENKCSVCGCGVRGLDKEFKTNLMNKLAHKSSACPKKKWHPVS